MAPDKVIAERLRLVAARCIVNSTAEWFSTSMTDDDEFRAVDYFDDWRRRAPDMQTPEDAANLLLLVAEALDE